MEKGSAAFLLRPATPETTAQTGVLAFAPKPSHAPETKGPSFLTELGRAIGEIRESVSGQPTNEAAPTPLGRGQEATTIEQSSNQTRQSEMDTQKADGPNDTDRSAGGCEKTERVREDQGDTSDERTDKDRREKDRTVAREATRPELTALAGFFPGHRPAPTLVMRTEGKKPEAAQDAAAALVAHRPAARLVKRETPQAIAAEVKSKDAGHEPVKVADKGVGDKRRPTVKGEGAGEKTTESFLPEALRPKSTKETVSQDTVLVRLNTEKWSVFGNPSQGKSDASQSQDKGSQEKHASGKDSPAKPSIRRTAQEIDGPGRSTPSTLLDTATLFRDQIHTADGGSEKARGMQNHRDLFNELVEKARMNFGSDGRSTAVIRMRPESLGQVTLNIRMHENQLEAKVLVDNKDAQKLLNHELDGLRKELAAQGIQVDSIVVHVRESFGTPAGAQDGSMMSAFNDGSSAGNSTFNGGDGSPSSDASDDDGGRYLQEELDNVSHIVFSEEYTSVNVKA